MKAVSFTSLIFSRLHLSFYVSWCFEVLGTAFKFQRLLLSPFDDCFRGVFSDVGGRSHIFDLCLHRETKITGLNSIKYGLSGVEQFEGFEGSRSDQVDLG